MLPPPPRRAPTAAAVRRQAGARKTRSGSASGSALPETPPDGNATLCQGTTRTEGEFSAFWGSPDFFFLS